MSKKLVADVLMKHKPLSAQLQHHVQCLLISSGRHKPTSHVPLTGLIFRAVFPLSRFEDMGANLVQSLLEVRVLVRLRLRAI